MAEMRSLAAVPEDYRRFLVGLETDDSAYRGSWIEPGETHADWLHEVAEPWWAAIRTLARADGLELQTYETRPASIELIDHQRWACARLAKPDGTRYSNECWIASTIVVVRGASRSYWKPRVVPILAAARRDYGRRVRDAQRRLGVVPLVGEVHLPPLSEFRGEAWKQTLADGDRITTDQRDGRGLVACTVVGWELDSYQYVWYLEVEPDGCVTTAHLRELEIISLLSKAA
jgi:hypothetical protein